MKILKSNSIQHENSEIQFNQNEVIFSFKATKVVADIIIHTLLI